MRGKQGEEGKMKKPTSVVTVGTRFRSSVKRQESSSSRVVVSGGRNFGVEEDEGPRSERTGRGVDEKEEKR